jgi:hypothetical protein
VSIKVRHRGFQRSCGYFDRQRLGDNPQAVLLSSQTRLAVCDQRVEEILSRLIEEAKVGTPGHHVANDVDSGLLHLCCHWGHLQFPTFRSRKTKFYRGRSSSSDWRFDHNDVLAQYRISTRAIRKIKRTSCGRQ